MANEYLSVDCPALEPPSGCNYRNQNVMNTQTYRVDPNAESDNWDWTDNEW